VTSANKQAVVILSQLKLLSRKRLHTKIDTVSVEQFAKIKKAVSKILNDFSEH
jgi:mRNA-degrading endonuclease toxin of MazEF toxin-antitoxin module